MGAALATHFEASGFFALRTPLLPFEEFERWSSGLESARVLQEDDARARGHSHELAAQARPADGGYVS